MDDFSREHVTRQTIEKNIVGMKVKDITLYQRALVHKSMQKLIRKHENVLPYLLNSNERLEFIGDCVLGMIIGDYLFDKYESCDEGFLTRMRTKLVNGKSLANFARHLNLGEYILMGKHVINLDGKDNNHILEDAFEAIIGAIYKDLGLKFARAFVLRQVEKHIDFDNLLIDDNFKDILLRYSQSKSLGPPQYETISQAGPPHKPTFTVKVFIGSIHTELGIGQSKKEAEQDAAKKLSNRLSIECNRDIVKCQNNYN